MPELSRHIDKPFFLSVVGNKSDLKGQRSVDEAHGKELVSYIKKKYPTINVVQYVETSAKENENVDVAFFDLVQKYIDSKNVKTSSRRSKK